MKVLIGVCARQHPQIFRLFLTSLFRLNLDGLEVRYHFIFHNWEAGKKLLANTGRAADVEVQSYRSEHSYVTDASTHRWTPALVRDLTAMRNSILRRAVEGGFDAVFMVDSDLLLQPPTLRHLSESGRDVIAEVFWTRWQPHGPELPNAWDYDDYRLTPDSLRQWRRPGQYRVGGAGACTLIATGAVRRGLSYSPVPFVSWFGEDRALQLRAAVLDIPIYLDTHYPACHIYRLEDLPRARAWYSSLDAGGSPSP